jgi:hypothetical protein
VVERTVQVISKTSGVVDEVDVEMAMLVKKRAIRYLLKGVVKVV